MTTLLLCTDVMVPGEACLAPMRMAREQVLQGKTDGFAYFPTEIDR